MLRLILQTDYRLNEYINKTGCAFRAIGAAVEDYTGKVLMPAQILEVYDEALFRGAIDYECKVNSWTALIEIYGDVLNERLTGYDIATQKPYKAPHFYDWVKDYAEKYSAEYKEYQYRIRWNHIDGSPSGLHARLFSKGARELFDPMPLPTEGPIRFDVLIRIKGDD